LLKIKLPIKTVSEGNKSEHWSKKSKRHKNQKFLVKLALADQLDTLPSLPVQITLTRVAPRSLDRHDNLPMALKYVLDAICEILIPNKAIGQADGDPRIQVKYEQIRGVPKEYAIEIEITHLANP
jgi:hypothetical protein